MATEIGKKRFYDIRLIFRKIREANDNYRVVRVTLRDSKIGKPSLDENFPFPDNISENELLWRTHKGEYVAVYHRKGIREYVDVEHSLVHTSLSQRLEEIVMKVLKPKNQ